MPRGKQSKGQCVYCRQEIAKGGVAKHLAACPERQAVMGQAERTSTSSETLYHLRVQAIGQNQFWLDLEMRGSATLKQLDRYLRAIWLECCGHLSRFSLGGWAEGDIAMSRRAQQVFAAAPELTHQYDFGTTSETLIKVVGTREGNPTTRHAIALMARNLMPEAQCIVCQQPANWLCVECLVEQDVWGALCDEHARAHPHENYGEPIRLVNSPRLGMCGYTGPAVPPY